MTVRFPTLAGAVGIGLTSMATPASATLYFFVDITVDGVSKTLSCAATAACNTSGSPDELTLGTTTLNGVVLRGEDDFASGTPTNPGLDYLYSTVGSVKNTSSQYSATVEVIVAATSFSGPVSIANLAANGTFLESKNSTYVSNWFVSASNVQGGVGGATPGAKIDTFSLTPPVSSINQGVSYSSPDLPVSYTSLFSVTEETTYTVAPDGTITNRGQSAVFTAIPEMSTWAMMVAGFAGLGLAGFGRERRSIV